MCAVEPLSADVDCCRRFPKSKSLVLPLRTATLAASFFLPPGTSWLITDQPERQSSSRVKWMAWEGRQGQRRPGLGPFGDDEFRAQYQQAHGAAENARAITRSCSTAPSRRNSAREHNLRRPGNWPTTRLFWIALRNLTIKACCLNKLSMMRPPSSKPISSARIRWREVFNLQKIGPRAEEIARAKGAMIQAEGQEAYAKSLLDAT